MSILRPRLWAPLLLILVPGLAACGSSSSSPGTAGAGSGSGAYNQGLAFARCMRSHGVPNFPDPKASGNGGIEIQATQRGGSGQSLKINGVPVNAPAFQSAQQACHSLLPNGGRPPQLSASQRQAMLQFSQCMRAHGLTNFPDPQFSGGRVGLQIRDGSGLDPNSPAFKQAQAACAQYQRQAFGTQKGP
jgi:hypothetical protein